MLASPRFANNTMSDLETGSRNDQTSPLLVDIDIDVEVSKADEDRSINILKWCLLFLAPLIVWRLVYYYHRIDLTLW